MTYFRTTRSSPIVALTFLAPIFLAVAALLVCSPVTADPVPVSRTEHSGEPRAPEGRRVARITMANFAFSPQTLTVPAGTMLVWTNDDDAPHTVKGVSSDSQIASQALDTGETFSAILRHPGRYKYFCTLHPFMVGWVIVQ